MPIGLIPTLVYQRREPVVLKVVTNVSIEMRVPLALPGDVKAILKVSMLYLDIVE